MVAQPVTSPGSCQGSLPWRFPSEGSGASSGCPEPLRTWHCPRGSGLPERMESLLVGKTKDLHSAGSSPAAKALYTCRPCLPGACRHLIGHFCTQTPAIQPGDTHPIWAGDWGVLSPVAGNMSGSQNHWGSFKSTPVYPKYISISGRVGRRKLRLRKLPGRS